MGMRGRMIARYRTGILESVAALDWMMRRPGELETELWHDVENIEGARQVKRVTSVERLAQATPEQLELWVERILEAGGLDDVLGGN